ncbi:DUF2066 domain-containing protein [Taklimakanibacter lacteus]|uniref:DUF2066 domain-containing protein n=1 Tax=Taklimakanibacter lacteus TaxID=2268456 RepID=UPI0013C47591
MTCRSGGLLAAVLALLVFLAPVEASAVGPVETGLFSVTGVQVDVTDTDAATARTRAIIEAQVKAFYMLAERLGSPEATQRLQGMDARDIGRMLRSLSIEEERSGPGRYIGKLTVRFLPGKIREVFGRYGIDVVEDQAPPIVVLPLWKGPNGPVIWEDNLWRKAWLDLKAEQSLVPIIVPLGDLADTSAISAMEVEAGDAIKLESLMIRYEAKAILVAVAEPDPQGGIHAVMQGDSPLGRINFDKVYTAEDGTLEGAAAAAAKRFDDVMLEKWRSVRIKVAADARARAAAQQQASRAASSMAIAVPFSGIYQWNGIRARLLATPGVLGVDVSTIAENGAVIQLAFADSIQDLQSALSGSGLRLVQSRGTWVLQPL